MISAMILLLALLMIGSVAGVFVMALIELRHIDECTLAKVRVAAVDRKE
jgi:hypothetical protein